MIPRLVLSAAGLREIWNRKHAAAVSMQQKPDSGTRVTASRQIAPKVDLVKPYIRKCLCYVDGFCIVREAAAVNQTGATAYSTTYLRSLVVMQRCFQPIALRGQRWAIRTDRRL